MLIVEWIRKYKESDNPAACTTAHILELAFDMDWMYEDIENIGIETVIREIKESEFIIQLAERIACRNA